MVTSTRITSMVIYHRSRIARVFDAIDAVLYSLYVPLRWLLRYVAVPLAIYLGPIALLWVLYRAVAGAVFPAVAWALAISAPGWVLNPAFWPFVGVATVFYILFRAITTFRMEWRWLGNGVEWTLYLRGGHQ